VDIRFVDDQRFLISGGGGVSDGYAPTLWSLSGEQLYRFPASLTKGLWHHDAILLPDGAILGLAEAENTKADGSTFTGMSLEARDPDTGLLTWSWNSQGAVDAGTLPSRGYHANAIQYVEDAAGPSIYVSAKLIDSLFRIAYPTGEVTWMMGQGREFALFDGAGAPLGDADWFYGQHALEVQGDTILLYDNGVRAPVPLEEARSRAIELTIDIPGRRADVTWSYSEPGWREPNWGDVDRLGNGNLLIGIGHCWACDESDVHATDVLEVQRDGTEVWRMSFSNQKDALYRADRLDGCALFRNKRACPEL
jgi:hypothetical protein